MYQFLAIPNKMNITLFLSSLFFVLDEFPEWECKEAVNFVIDKQYSVSALCPLQCDTKIQKFSATALKKMSKMLKDIKLDNDNEYITTNILYTLVTIICVQTVCILACGWKIVKNSKNETKETIETTELTEIKEESVKQESE